MFIQSAYLLVSDHTGANRGGTDLRDTQIASNNGLRRHLELEEFIALNQLQIRLNMQNCATALLRPWWLGRCSDHHNLLVRRVPTQAFSQSRETGLCAFFSLNFGIFQGHNLMIRSRITPTAWTSPHQCRARVFILQQSQHNPQESHKGAALCLVFSPRYVLNLVKMLSENHAEQLTPLFDPHLYGSLMHFGKFVHQGLVVAFN